MNKVVARFVDGRTVKGTTADFFPGREKFHVSEDGGAPREILMKDLKAVFFVKDLAGNSAHVERNEFDAAHPQAGRKMKVVFRDGEVLIGTTTGYQRDRPGFFIIPADHESNIERCYVVASSAAQVSFI